METLIRGVHYCCRNFPNECYYWEKPTDSDKAKKKEFPFEPDTYPFIVVNIGSGVSMLHVMSEHKFKRIGGNGLIDEWMEGKKKDG